MEKNMQYILIGIVAFVVITNPSILTSISNGVQGLIPGSSVNPGGNNQQVANTLDFYLQDAYAGSGMNAKTVAVYRDGILIETCTTASDGTIETAKRYVQGETLDLYIDCGSNERWDRIVVPVHPANLIEASDPTPVDLLGSTHPTLTDYNYIGGTVTASGGDWNQTAASGTAMVTYGWEVGTDDTGLLESDFDPIYNANPGVVCFVEASAGSYSSVSLTGYDGFYQMGSKYIWWYNVPASECSKDKIGVNYASGMDGSASLSFAIAASGVASNVTILITLYEYADAQYYIAHGSQIAGSTSLCTTTWTVYA